MRATTILATAMVMIMAAAPAAADAMLDRLRAEARAMAPQSFERTLRTEVAGDAATVRIDRFDPARPAGSQWTLVSVDGRAPTADEQKRYQREVTRQPAPGFHRVPYIMDGPPTAVERQGDRTIYRWQALKPGAVPAPRGPDVSERLSAEANVVERGGKPQLEKIRIFAAQPFAVMGVARMNRFEVTSLYSMEGGGHRLARQTTELDVRVPVRGTVAQRNVASFRPI